MTPKKKKTIFTKILLLSTFLLLSLIGISLILAYVYEDKIKAYSIQQINNNINAKIDVDKIELNFLAQFPRISLDFNTVNMHTQDSQQNLINAKHIYLSFDLFDVLAQKYIIKEVVFEKATINFIIDKEGRNNFQIFKSSQQNGNSFLLNLNAVHINNCVFNYENKSTRQQLALLIKEAKFSGLFSANNMDIKLQGKNIIQSYINQGRTIIRNKQLNLDVILVAEPDLGTYRLKSGFISYQAIPLQLSGNIGFKANSISIDAYLKATNLSAHQLIKNLPTSNKIELEKYNINGRIDISASVRGIIGGNKSPHIDLNAGLHNFVIENILNGLKLNNLNLKLTYTNGKRNNLHTSVLKINSISSNTNVGKFQGNISIDNLWSPKLKAVIKSQLKLKALAEYLKLDTIKTLRGEAFTTSWISLSLNHNDSKNQWYIDKIAMDHNFKISKGTLLFAHSTILYDSIYAKGRLSNTNLTISQLKFNTGDSKLSGSISIYNLPIPIFETGHKPYLIRGQLSANQISYNQISNALPVSESTDSRFSNALDLNLKLDIKRFSYKKILAKNIHTNFIMRNRKIRFPLINGDIFSGNIAASLILDGSRKGEYSLYSDGTLSTISINQAFTDFDNFGQTTLTNANIKGDLNANYILKCKFNPQWEINTSSIVLSTDMIINNGELMNMKSLNALKSYTKIDDFSHIKFSTIKNSISIKEGRIIVPDMAINSNKMNINLSGTHDFDNRYNYHFVVLLSEIMGKRYHDKLNSEFGEIQNDGYGRTRLFFTIKGQGDKFEVSYDKSGLGKKLKHDLKEEKSSLKTALHKEFGWFKDSTDKVVEPKKNRKKKKEKEILKKQEEGKFIIDWDDDDDTIK